MDRKVVRSETTTSTVVTVGSVRFGWDPFPVIAGPCAIESPEQLGAAARMVAERGASMLRGGAYKAGSSPYGFRGLGPAALEMLALAGREVGLPTTTQVIEPGEVERVAGQIDMIEIGSANMQNFELLREAGRAGLPVLLRRGPSATIDEWLWAAEYLLAEGNDQVVLVERGIRTFGDRGGDTLDIGAIPAVKEQSHLPVLVDPSHASGGGVRVSPLALAAQGVGADGLIVEVHPQPERALSDGPPQLDGEAFSALMDALGVNKMRKEVDLVDREIVRLMADRQRLALAIGRVKATRGMPVRAPSREAELLDIIREEAVLQGIDPEHAVAVFDLILDESREAQRRERGELR